MNKPKKLLKDVTFDWEPEDDKDLGAHLAYTLDIQGGAASGYNKPLLLKSEKPEVTPEIIKSLEELGIDTAKIMKSIYQEDKRSLLISAIREKEFTSKYDFFWVVDFNDELVVFACDEGLYSVDYTINDTTVTIGDKATPVIPMKDYKVDDARNILISEELEDQLDKQMLEMVSKASSVEKVKEFIVKAVTKKEGNEELKASYYAYTPDKEKPSTWKLRIDDARHVAAAVAALGKGLRGNKVDIPADDLEAVKKKVAKAYKKFFPDNDLPEVLESVNKSSVITENQPESEKDISVKTNENKGVSKVDNLNLQDVMKSAEMQELLKGMIEKATAEKDEKLAKAQLEIENLQKAEAQRIEKNFVDIVKSFEFVEEDKTEALVKGFVENPEFAMVVVDILHKASEQVEQVKTEFSKEIGLDTVDKSKAVKVDDKIAELAAKVRKSNK